MPLFAEHFRLLQVANRFNKAVYSKLQKRPAATSVTWHEQWHRRIPHVEPPCRRGRRVMVWSCWRYARSESQWPSIRLGCTRALPWSSGVGTGREDSGFEPSPTGGKEYDSIACRSRPRTKALRFVRLTGLLERREEMKEGKKRLARRRDSETHKVNS